MVWIVGIGIGLFLLFAFPRQMLLLIAGLTVLGLGTWAYLYYQEQSRKSLEEKVHVLVVYDADRCNEEFPLLVTIRNTSKETVESTSFDLSGFRSGHSAPVYQRGYLDYKTDKIIPPGKGYSGCWRVPDPAYSVSQQTIAATPPEAAVWKVTRTNPRFQK